MSDSETSNENSLLSIEPIEHSCIPQESVRKCSFYRYEPLQTPASIRILSLFPGGPVIDLDPLRGSLEEVSLDSSPQYQAVSYVWGDPAPTWPIFLQDSVLLVPQNAASLLKRLRQPHGVFSLWIDAICINQNHIQERNAQVQLMRNIYASASKVLIYVGEEFCQDSQTLDFFATIFRARQKLVRAGGDQGSKMLKADQYEEVGLPTEDNDVWDLLPEFLCLPWFSRVWVLQEVVFAQEPCLITGIGTLDMSLFFVVMDAIFIHSLPWWGSRQYDSIKKRERLIGARKFVINISTLKKAQRDGDQFSLISLLQEYRYASATDPRDKIFALIALSGEADETELRPDYAEDLNNTYKRFAKYFIEHEQGSQVLFNAGYDEAHQNLPTWLPKWASSGNEAFDTYLTDDRRLTEVFKAHGQTQVSMHLGADESILEAQGLLFDTIQRIETVEVADKRSWEIVAAYVEEIDQIWQLLGERYPTGETCDVVTWRTLLQDREKGRDEQASAANLIWYDAFKCVYAIAIAEPDSPSLSEAIHGDVKDLLTALELPFDQAHVDFITAKGNDFESTVLERSREMRRATTGKGYLCQVLPQVQVGDVIAIFFGCEIPYIVRPREWNQFQLIGGCYVHGIMYGEGLEMEEAKVETINLI